MEKVGSIPTSGFLGGEFGISLISLSLGAQLYVFQSYAQKD